MFPLRSKIMPKSGRPKLAVIMSLGFTVLLAPILATTANAVTCTQLQHQLASVGQSQSGSKKYRHAANRQRKQLNILNRALKRAGCTGLGASNQTRNAKCTELLSTRNRMESRLQSLRRKAGGDNNSIDRKRRRIKLKIRRKGCGTQSVSVLPKRSKKRSLVKEIYGNIDHRREIKKPNGRSIKQLKRSRKRKVSLNRFFSPGTPVTTVCVRTCDGYHFPVNFSGRQGNFENASDVCRTMCPGAKMALYVRRSSNKSTNNLYSAATGEPYAALPKSFAFQKSFNPNCSCNYKLLNQARTVRQASNTKQNLLSDQNEPAPKATIPVPRIDRGQDPETMQNMTGSWSLKTAQNIKKPRVETVVTNKEPKKVRIVGDKYFPGQ